jgi:hypothetical protein
VSAVEEGEGLATVEDITVARLGIGLERDDTSAGTAREMQAGARTFHRCLGRRTARCSFPRSGREATEEEGERGSAGRMEVLV